MVIRQQLGVERYNGMRKKTSRSQMSYTGQVTTCWSHHRELHCGTDSKPTTPQGTGLRYWPQTITRTMFSIMQHGRRINKTQDQQYHASMSWNNIIVPLHGCTTKLRIMSNMIPILGVSCRSKWISYCQVKFQQMFEDKHKIYTTLFLICHRYSVQSARAKRESCDNSLTSKPAGRPTDKKQKSRGMSAVRGEVLFWSQWLPLVFTNDTTFFATQRRNSCCQVRSATHRSLNKNLHFYRTNLFDTTNLAFYDTLIRFTGNVNLVHSPPQVVEEERPIACSQIHLAGLSGFGGALLSPFVQQDTNCALIFHHSILWR